MTIALRHLLGVLLLMGGGALAAERESAAETDHAVEVEPAAEVESATEADSAAEAETPQSAPRPPYELTRSLQALQDQMALGSTAAASAQRALLIHIDEQFRAAGPEVWREPANARAAIVYVLSGGRPHLLHQLIEGGHLPDSEMEIARGALAYATGRRDEAWTLLEKADARALAPSLGAHVALAQASLAMENDPPRAVEYLETARLLAPGTLIEEAALRRQLSVTSALSDAESFMALARQYVRRFPTSVYAANFLRSFPDLWADLDLPGDAETFAKLEATVAGLDNGDRRELYLALAHQRLVAGDLGIARLAASGAAGLAEAGSAQAARAALYKAAAEVASGEPARVLEALAAFDPASLSEADAELHAAALALAEEVQRELGPARLPEGDAADLEAAEVLERGREALAAVDALLERTR